MNIIELVEKIEEDVIKWRRFLHENPEVGLDLPISSGFVEEKLREFEIPYEKSIGTKYTIIAKIKGDNPGKTIAFRADMDGLSIVEDSKLSFASKNGAMHACGHDGHTAALLGAGKIINENKENLNGNIVLIFQTAEEISKGAKPILQSGILKDYNVEEIYGLHMGGIFGGKETGKFIFNPGPAMACLDSFKIRVYGKAAHGAYPNKSVDPITISSYIISSLQEIISREIDPTSPGVISIGKIRGGTSYNIIPEYVELEGTARSVTEEQRQFIKKRIGEISESIASGFRAQVQYEYTLGAPALVNNRSLTEKAIKSAKKLFGEDDVIINSRPVMGGEDFAEYLNQIPGSFIFLENMMPIDGKIYPHHNPKFALDESKFKKAVGLFVQIAFDN